MSNQPTPCGTVKCYAHNTEFFGHCSAPSDKPRLIECSDYKPDATERMYEIQDGIVAEVKSDSRS